MIKIGDICPLFFNPIKNEFQQDIDYIQRFHITDQILFQVFSDDSGDVVSCYVKDLVANENIPVSFDKYQINSTTILYQAKIFGLKDSIYKLIVEEENTGDVHESELFSVCSDNILLQETCLIRYSHEDNNSPFDNIFWIDESQQVFEFRVEGGFKPEGVSSKVDNEQFRNQLQNIVELYSVPYDVYTFTCGNASGIPYWIVRFINNILSLSHFGINEKMYVRSGNSTPEKTAVSEDGQMFNATILLESNNSEYLGLLPNTIRVIPTEIKASSTHGEYNILLKSNAKWYAKSSPIWTSIDMVKGNAGIHSINIKVSENTGTANRSGTVIFSIAGEDITAELTVNQDASPFEPSITVTPNVINDVVAEGAEEILQLTSNAAWSLFEKPAWVTVSPNAGEAGNFNVNVTIAPNTGVLRSGTVRFINNTTQEKDLMVFVQLAGEARFETIPTDIVDVPSSGGTRTVQLYCTNENWLLTYVPNWVNVEPNTGTDDAVLTVTIEPNTGAARNEAIQIDNLGTGATLEIGVYQLAASSGKYLNVSDYYYNNNGIAATRQIGVDTNVDDLIIEVADYPSWLEDAFLSASNDTLNLLYGANPNSTPQFAVVKFVSEKYPEVNKDFYAINGAPAGLDYSVLIPPGDGGVIEQERSAGTIKTYLFDNVTTYLDDEGTSWFSGIDYDAEPGKGKVVKIYPKANTASTERIANIICKRGSDDEILSGIEVRQSATGYYIEHDGEPNIIVGSSAVTVSRTITVGTSIPNNPTATSEATWINSIKVTPMVNDDFNVQFKVAVNSTGVERTGIVRVTFMDVHYDFSITQGK